MQLQTRSPQQELLTSPAGLTLNQQQTDAVVALEEWWDIVKRIPPRLLEHSEKFIGLRGIPGSGKSTCIWTFVNKVIKESRWAIALAAPTHDAKGVLIQMAIENGMSGCSITTIASLLGTKARLDDDGEDEFIFVREKLKIDAFDLVILDETSMMNEEQWEYIKKIPNCPPIITIGDIEQLRPVKHRSKSPVFAEISEWLTLTEPMRFGGNIRRLVAKVEASRHFVNPTEFADGKSVIILPNYEWIDSLAEDIANDIEGNKVRSLVFTNKLTNWLNTNLHIEVSLRRQGLSSYRSLFPFPVEPGDQKS